jgi:hypothetical protein
MCLLGEAKYRALELIQTTYMYTIPPSPHLILILPLDHTTHFLLYLGRHISLSAKMEGNAQTQTLYFETRVKIAMFDILLKL